MSVKKYIDTNILFSSNLPIFFRATIASNKWDWKKALSQYRSLAKSGVISVSLDFNKKSSCPFSVAD